MDGAVWTVQLAGGHLLIAGMFTTVNGAAHAGLASLNPTTGALDPYINIQLAGHHNYTGQPSGCPTPRSAAAAWTSAPTAPG